MRYRLRIRGRVQGVGFRPYVYRLARRWELAGCVSNDGHGVRLEVEGDAAAVAAFRHALLRELPPLARIEQVEEIPIRPLGERSFSIGASSSGEPPRAQVTPDAATCPDCLAELFDPGNRRYRHPFINCTNCGPRYSIIRAIPYDRPATTMTGFRLCPACAGEYAAPADRRFHAQPIACRSCGPTLRLLAPDGSAIHGDAIAEAARRLACGAILAIKGIGGYHLSCRADDEVAVGRLRARKLRDGKPLALMVARLADAEGLCVLSDADRGALASPAAPIVLAPRRPDAHVAGGVAPGVRDLGVMLAYAPVHHLLFAAGLGPLVMTSGNLAGQPLTYRDDEALAALGDVADALLTHDRPICRPIDDSVVFTWRGALRFIRRARGYVPQRLPAGLPPGTGGRTARVLAVGAELKSTVCLLSEDGALVSEHLGDLTHPDAYRHFVQAVQRLEALFAFTPEAIACDAHPQYLSTHYAGQRAASPADSAGTGRSLALVRVQHHHAHAASVMAEHGEHGPLLGVVCDGAGAGEDGAVWGCELLVCRRDHFERVGHLAYTPLLGADAAAVQTWRPACAWLRRALGPDWVQALRDLPAQVEQIEQQGHAALHRIGRLLEQRRWTPTSSLGRVFDAAAFLLGLCSRNRHEAEAAMALEAAAAEYGDRPVAPLRYRVAENPAGLIELSPAPALGALLAARRAGGEPGELAAAFHETVAAMLAEGAQRACRRRGLSVVALSGGCFANRILLERVTARLEGAGLRVLTNGHVPAGDGGVSLGQAYVAAWRLGGGVSSGQG